MGSNPPRRRSSPRPAPPPAPPPAPTQPPAEATPAAVVVGIVAVPVMMGSGFMAWLAAGTVTAVGVAVGLAVVVMAAAALLVTRFTRHRSLDSTNELVAAVLLGILGLTFTLGGFGAGSVTWMIPGALLLTIAAVIALPTIRSARRLPSHVTDT